MKKMNLVLFLIAVILFSLLIFIKTQTYEAMDEIDLTIEMDNVEMNEEYIVFNPEGEIKANLVFYQGGLVSTESYGKLAYGLSKEGIRVFLPKMPLNLAIIKKDAFEDIYNESSNGKPWYIGGHSLGGVSATMYFIDNQEKIEGIVYMGSYPDEKRDISGIDIKVLSILGSNDGNVDKHSYEEAMTRLPDDTEYVIIEGGNHSNFGHYGDQKGDKKAEISREEQIRITVSEVVDFILSDK